MSFVDPSYKSIEALFCEYINKVSKIEATVSTPNSEYPIRIIMSENKKVQESDPQNQGTLEKTGRLIHYQILPEFLKSSTSYGNECYKHMFITVTDQKLINFLSKQQGFLDNDISTQIIHLKRGSGGTQNYYQKHGTMKLEKVSVVDSNLEPRLQPDRTKLYSYWLIYAKIFTDDTLYEENMPKGRIALKKDFETVTVEN